MLSMTRKAEYALIAVCHLARVGRNAVTSARDVHEQHGVPLPLLMNVLKKLNHAGIVASQRGAHGGYMLTRGADEISLTDIIEAVEGPVQLVRCNNLSKSNRKCSLSGHCPIQVPVHKIHHRLREFLCNVSIAELAFEGFDKTRELKEVVAE